MNTLENKKLAWLGTNLFMVLSMVIIGGITRLTDSGLSMTTWNLIKGVIPPLIKRNGLMFSICIKIIRNII